MLLLLMRHAQAASPGQGFTDDKRPLTPAGQDQVREVAEQLRKRGISIEVIVTSPLVRARDTATLLAGSLGVRALESSPLLASRGTAPLIQPLLEKHKNCASLLLVGHQPDIGQLAFTLCGNSLPFGTASIAAIEWTGSGQGTYLWSVSPSSS